MSHPFSRHSRSQPPISSLLWPAWVRLLLASVLSACLWLLLVWAEQV